MSLNGTDAILVKTAGGAIDKSNTIDDVRNFTIPSQAGSNGKFLTTNGTATSWASMTPSSNWLMPCRAAYWSNQSLTPGGTTLTIDSVLLANGDRVLLAGQTTASQNGVYLVTGIGTSVALSRASDADTWPEIASSIVYITEGTNYGLTTWRNINTTGTLGTTAIGYAVYLSNNANDRSSRVIGQYNGTSAVMGTGTQATQLYADNSNTVPLSVTITPVADCIWNVNATVLFTTATAAWNLCTVRLKLSTTDNDGNDLMAFIGYGNASTWPNLHHRCLSTWRLSRGTSYTCSLILYNCAGSWTYWKSPLWTSISSTVEYT